MRMKTWELLEQNCWFWTMFLNNYRLEFTTKEVSLDKRDKKSKSSTCSTDLGLWIPKSCKGSLLLFDWNHHVQPSLMFLENYRLKFTTSMNFLPAQQICELSASSNSKDFRVSSWCFLAYKDISSVCSKYIQYEGNSKFQNTPTHWVITMDRGH